MNGIEFSVEIIELMTRRRGSELGGLSLIHI